ncbi:MAG: HEAT repeat domain-containing protein [Deltaproteobacteria bacterium]|nr:HEAT repeat domain-containing protein [Deltaproteobacteria bacterium]
MTTVRQSSGDDRFNALRERAGEFTLNLVKALLQTGYYSSDHPLAKVAAKELHNQFQELTREAFEVSYVLLSSTDDRGIMVDGLTEEAVEVSRFLTGTMGDHFSRKFHDYFLRNKIASLTIKRGITEKEFSAFMDLWVTWAARVGAAERTSAVTMMSDELTRAGILAVTVVGMSDVPGSVRQLPWPVKVSLGRLRTDLMRLPELRKVRPEALKQLKAQAVSDVVRAMSKPGFTRDLLLNSDLAGEGLAAFSRGEIENSMVSAIPPRALLPLLNEMMELRNVLERGDLNLSLPGRDIIEYRETVNRVVGKVLQRVAAQPDLPPQANDVLLKSYNAGLIEQDDLPSALRRRLKAFELADRFMRSPEMYLKDFAQCAGPKSYIKYLNVLSLIIPALIERKEVKELSSILDIMHRHMNEDAPPFVGRKRFLEETLIVIERSGAVEGLIDLAVSTPKDERQVLENGVAMFGDRAVGSLVRILSTSEDVSERKAACSMLELIGEAGQESLIKELDSHSHPWFAVRNIIGILGELRLRKALDSIRHYRSHPHPRVREECVNAIGLILDEAGEKDLLSFLRDKDQAVVRRAIHFLATMHSCESGFLKVLNETIKLRSRNEEEPDQIAQSTCLAALAMYQNAPLPASPNFESTLAEIIHPPKVKTMLPGRMGIRKKPPELVVLAIRALGSIGSSRSLSLLSDLSKESDEIRRAAADAIEQITNRQTHQVVQKPLRY